MNLTPKRLLGATAAVVTGATALLGTGVGTAGSAGAADTAVRADRAARADGAVRVAVSAASVNKGGSTQRAHRAHCDRVERPIWSGDGSGDPSRNMTGHGCSLPDSKRPWYKVEIDTLVEPHHKTNYLNGEVDRTETLHDRTITCMGYTSDNGTVNWFGCIPH
ncbi:hypothetical protein [Streptomyces sp. NPDC046805]|uniref:hypothetical protein n=1 Tax=Streptomyces sp. NPDC046805 TaxID=3155134 RepID=UPI0033FB4DA7